MELGAHMWLRKEDSHWGWVPAVITEKVPVNIRGVDLINLTLCDDPELEFTMPNSSNKKQIFRDYHQESFSVVITVDPEQLKFRGSRRHQVAEPSSKLSFGWRGPGSTRHCLSQYSQFR